MRGPSRARHTASVTERFLESAKQHSTGVKHQALVWLQGRLQDLPSAGQALFCFGLIVGMIRERLAHDQQAVLIDSDLGIVVLIKALVRAVFHDPRRWVREIVLVRGACCMLAVFGG